MLNPFFYLFLRLEISLEHDSDDSIANLYETLFKTEIGRERGREKETEKGYRVMIAFCLPQ